MIYIKETLMKFIFIFMNISITNNYPLIRHYWICKNSIFSNCVVGKIKHARASNGGTLKVVTQVLYIFNGDFVVFDCVHFLNQKNVKLKILKTVFLIQKHHNL